MPSEDGVDNNLMKVPRVQLHMEVASEPLEL